MIRRSIIILAALVLFFGPASSAHADTREELLAQIEDLKAIIAELTEALRDKIFNENKDFRFERNLFIGSVGADVEKLQTFLAKNTQFYPEGLVTGYYGELTSGAIERLKNEYQIEEPGFGKETRAALNKLFQEKSTFVVSTSGFVLSPIQSEEGRGSSRSEEEEEKIRVEDIARDIHIAINKVRVQSGLNALDWDEGLAAVARAHSLDQSRDNKDLTNPDLLCQYPTIRHEGFVSGFGVRDRVISADVDFKAVGENIAMIPGIKSRSYTLDLDEETPDCPASNLPRITSPKGIAAYRESLKDLLETAESIRPVTFVREVKYNREEIVDLAIDGWMNSPGHRENVLYKDYTHGGVGVVKINEYYIITHDFIGR